MQTGTLKGIGLFTMQVLHLISIGKKEKFEEVEKHFENEDIVEYLFKKYDEHFFIRFDGSVYDNAMLNKYFSNYMGYIEGNESRKYMIENEDNGLLLIPALLMDKVESESINWSV